MAIALGVLLVVGGGVAVASRSATGFAPYAAPRQVPATGAGSGEVELSADAAAHPAADAVREQLQRHFDAINTRDYESWRGTVVQQRADGLPEPEWQQAYASTRDGTIRIDRIDRIDAAPDSGLFVRVRFVSTQDVAHAPPDLQVPRICWRTTLPLRGLPPLIDMTGGGSSAREAC
ncbi:hypothetical protein [Pseudonocardia aurantiaca]|uniref:Uncharacterized protein n=1 Tax=Pseudonocardia aurantiaca TaxID=75290 RepID=A0ABW4FRJ4_9PSEU